MKLKELFKKVILKFKEAFSHELFPYFGTVFFLLGLIYVYKVVFNPQVSGLKTGVFENLVAGLVDVFTIFLLFSIIQYRYNKKKEQKQRITRLFEELDDYREWTEKEASYRVSGIVRRLRKEGSMKIDFNGLHGGRLPTKEIVDAINKGVKFSSLEESNIKNSNLDNPNLEEGNLDKSDMSYANWSKANLNFSSIKNATLLHTNLENSQLAYCKLDKSFVVRAKINNSDLEYASLKQANFRFTELQNSNLDFTEIKNSDFHSSNCTGSSFIDAKIEKSNFSESVLIGSCFNGAIIKNSNLSMCNLNKSSFFGANLENTRIVASNLEDSELLRSNLNGAILFEPLNKLTSLRGAILPKPEYFTQHLSENLDELDGALVIDYEWLQKFVNIYPQFQSSLKYFNIEFYKTGKEFKEEDSYFREIKEIFIIKTKFRN